MRQSFILPGHVNFCLKCRHIFWYQTRKFTDFRALLVAVAGTRAYTCAQKRVERRAWRKCQAIFVKVHGSRQWWASPIFSHFVRLNCSPFIAFVNLSLPKIHHIHHNYWKKTKYQVGRKNASNPRWFQFTVDIHSTKAGHGKILFSSIAGRKFAALTSVIFAAWNIIGCSFRVAASFYAGVIVCCAREPRRFLHFQLKMPRFRRQKTGAEQ